MLTVGAIVIFGSWLVLTVFNQKSGPVQRWIYGRDRLKIVPVWTFFAPEPGINDFHILYRDRFHDGGLSEWGEADPPRGRHLRTFWNPDKRHRKAVFDLSTALMEAATVIQDSRQLVITVPYLAILNYVFGFHPGAEAMCRQFAIVAGSGIDQSDDPTLLFVSRFHRLI